jgi:hypothetical protein
MYIIFYKNNRESEDACVHASRRVHIKCFGEKKGERKREHKS